MKPISTKTHGILDYASAAALLVLPRVLRMSKPITNVLTGAALLHTSYSLLTDYEMGAVKVIPMKGHLALDGVASVALASTPLVFQSVGRSTLLGFAALGLYEMLVVLNSESKRRKRFKLFEIFRK